MSVDCNKCKEAVTDCRCYMFTCCFLSAVLIGRRAMNWTQFDWAFSREITPMIYTQRAHL